MSQLDGSLSSIVRLTGGGTHQPPAFNLLAGQVYRATVEQVNAGAVLLRIGELSLRAVTDVKVMTGQTLLLKMNRETAPPSLEIIRVLPMPTHQASRQQQAPPEKSLNNRIQSLLSRQASPLMLFSILEQLDAQRHSPELIASAEAVKAHLLSPRQAGDPALLQAAIDKSGLWLEALLRALLTDPGQAIRLQDDLKFALLRLRALQGNASAPGLAQLLDEGLASTLSQITEGVLARMSLHQINSVLQAEQGHLHWSVDLPLHMADQTTLLSITIRREQGRNNGKENSDPARQSWQVELDTELARLGPVRISLFLRQQQLSVALEASRNNTVDLFAQSLLSLEEDLRDRGFRVETLLSRPLPAHAHSAGDPWFENLIEVSV